MARGGVEAVAIALSVHPRTVRNAVSRGWLSRSWALEMAPQTDDERALFGATQQSEAA